MDSKAEVTLTEWFEFNYVSVRKGEEKAVGVYTICKCWYTNKFLLGGDRWANTVIGTAIKWKYIIQFHGFKGWG